MLKEVSSKINESLKDNGYFTTILHGNDRRILDSCMESICEIGFDILQREKNQDILFIPLKNYLTQAKVKVTINISLLF